MDLVERAGSGARHPWEIARAGFFLRLLEQHGLLGMEAAWLDAGSGDGWFAAQLRSRVPERSSITCWDVNYTAADLDELGTAVAGVEFVAERPERRFDRILLLDVLEHVEEDVTFLASLVDNLLREDGYVVISVPAHQALFSSHDRLLRHFRRYAPADADGLVEGAGLQIVASGGLFGSLLPVRFAQVLVERVRDRSGNATGVGQWSGGRVTTGVVRRVLAADAALSLRASGHGRALPGLSYWALCRAR